MEWPRKYRLHIGAGVVGLVLLAAAVAWFRHRRRVARVEMERQQALEAERERLRLEAAEKAQEEARRLEEERMLKGLKIAPATNAKTMALKKHLDELAENDSEMFARLMKAWIHEDDQ